MLRERDGQVNETETTVMMRSTPHHLV